MPSWIKNNKTIFNYYNKHLKFNAIRKITKRWLKEHNIPSKNLLVEKAAIDVESARFYFWGGPRNNYKNRFYYSRKESYRYFVEDDLKNAVKLSANCEYVFLMNHPYNQEIMNFSIVKCLINALFSFCISI